MQVFRSQDMQRNAAALQDAAMQEPVIITYHDRPRLVLMSMEEYSRLRGRRKKVGATTDLPEALVREAGKLGEEEKAIPVRVSEFADGVDS